MRAGLDDSNLTVPLKLARVLAFLAVIWGVLAVLLFYESLPEQLPLTRWSDAPKTLLIATRIPLNNMLSLAFLELLCRALRRIKDLDLVRTQIALYLTLIAKAALGALELLFLESDNINLLLPLWAVILTGISAAAWSARRLFEEQRWRELEMKRAEKWTAGVLAILYLALNLPVLLA